jgi:hypothetical protein
MSREVGTLTEASRQPKDKNYNLITVLYQSSDNVLCMRRSRRRTALLLYLRPMRTRPRTAYSVPKIGEGSFLTSDLTRYSPQAGPLQHHIRRPVLAQPQFNTLSPLVILVSSRPLPLPIEAHPTPRFLQCTLCRRVRRF